MLQYLVIILDTSCPSFCHKDNPCRDQHLISLDILKRGIIWGMKENLMIHFVYPNYPIPPEYERIIDTIDNIIIGRDVILSSNLNDLPKGGVIQLRIHYEDFILHHQRISEALCNAERLNICFNNVEDFSDEKIPAYESALTSLSITIFDLYKHGKKVNFNLLTDRLYLDNMNNCGAGISNITLAPNGKFYICPSFFYDEISNVNNRLNHLSPKSDTAVGDLSEGLRIPNQTLLRLENAPICRRCDSYHCHRCVWYNLHLTGDINTPSHQQCIMAHIERRVSQKLSMQMRENGMNVMTIPEIDYLDPFELIIK